VKKAQHVTGTTGSSCLANHLLEMNSDLRYLNLGP